MINFIDSSNIAYGKGCIWGCQGKMDIFITLGELWGRQLHMYSTCNHLQGAERSTNT